MSPARISKFEQLKASGDLPTPKGVALAIIEMALREDVPVGDLVRVVKSDPAFVARLVRAANGLGAVRGRSAVSVHDAIVILGLPAVRSLALGFSLMTQHGRGACRAFDYERFWSHSVAAAEAMQGICAATRVAPPEETFTVGLLSRIGELALAALYPAAYSDLLEQPDRGEALLARERAAFAMNHRELAAAMMTDWGLPSLYVEAVFHLEEEGTFPFAEGSRPAIVLIALRLAHRMASLCLDERAAEDDEALAALAASLGLGGDGLSPLLGQVAGRWQEWRKLLRLDARRNAGPVARLPVPGAGADQAGSRIRVLVVDDDPALRALLRAALERHGNEVFEAPGGREGLEMALDLQPHMMIIDWVMPGMDGLALTKALRQTRVGRAMFIMILTAYEDDSRLILAFEHGVDDFMAKPIKPSVLAARLNAGQRVVGLQQEIERDRDEIRHFAAELAMSNRKLQEAALTDALTGFPNRRYAMERVQQEWSAAARGARELACMVVDLDGFKQVNDNHGHDAGDAVLREVAQRIRAALRAQDVVCRTGGDEFLVICPDTGLEAALACAERVRRAVQSTPLVFGATRLPCSLSIGVAVREALMNDPDGMIKVADQGLYRAKRRGRDRVATVQPVRA